MNVYVTHQRAAAYQLILLFCICSTSNLKQQLNHLYWGVSLSKMNHFALFWAVNEDKKEKYPDGDHLLIQLMVFIYVFW